MVLLQRCSKGIPRSKEEFNRRIPNGSKKSRTFSQAPEYQRLCSENDPTDRVVSGSCPQQDKDEAWTTAFAQHQGPTSTCLKQIHSLFSDQMGIEEKMEALASMGSRVTHTWLITIYYC